MLPALRFRVPAGGGLLPRGLLEVLDRHSDWGQPQAVSARAGNTERPSMHTRHLAPGRTVTAQHQQHPLGGPMVALVLTGITCEEILEN